MVWFGTWHQQRMIMLTSRFKQSQILLSNKWDESTFRFFWSNKIPGFSWPIENFCHRFSWWFFSLISLIWYPCWYKWWTIGQVKVDSSHSLLERICDFLNLGASIIILYWRNNIPLRSIMFGVAFKVFVFPRLGGKGLQGRNAEEVCGDE